MSTLDRKSIAVPGGPPLSYLTGGSGSPLVFLHGISGVEPDDALLGALANKRKIIAPIMPGRAAIEELDGIDDVRDLALYYDSALEALGLNGVTLVGHSFGGMLAAEIAAHVPARVKTLVLLSPIGLWNDAYPVGDVFARPYAAIDEYLRQGSRTEPPAKQVVIPASVDAELERQVMVVNGASSVAKFTWPIPEKGLRKRLHRIGAQTLVVFGKDDAYVPARYADDFVAAIRGSRKLVLDGSHMLPYEAPERIADEIVAFER